MEISLACDVSCCIIWLSLYHEILSPLFQYSTLVKFGCSSLQIKNKNNSKFVSVNGNGFTLFKLHCKIKVQGNEGMSIIHSPAAAFLQLIPMGPFKVTSISGKWPMDPQTILTVYTYLKTEIVHVFSARGMKK